jgi:hypothetical protein
MVIQLIKNYGDHIKLKKDVGNFSTNERDKFYLEYLKRRNCLEEFCLLDYSAL